METKMSLFLSTVTVIDDGDEKSWLYGIMEVSWLDAKECLRRFLADQNIEFSKIEEPRLAKRGEAARLLNLPLCGVQRLF
jgi:hypothetical protein